VLIVVRAGQGFHPSLPLSRQRLNARRRRHRGFSNAGAGIIRYAIVIRFTASVGYENGGEGLQGRGRALRV
jgi:hypothetical protein